MEAMQLLLFTALPITSCMKYCRRLLNLLSWLHYRATRQDVAQEMEGN